MSRIQEMFARLAAEGRTALMPYLMVGYPQRDSVLTLAPALEAAGADLFELGVPFSDPLADGVAVQHAGQVALRNGVRVLDCLETVRQLRANGLRAPVVLMGCYNPFLQYGLSRFCADAADAGADGLIIPDLPPEEAAEARAACSVSGLDLIMFVTPTSTDARLAQVARLASGFVYCVSVTGVTGARAELWDGLPALLQRVRRFTDVPLVVGFGISTAAHVRSVSQHAQGAISGSALINVLDPLPPEQHVDAAVAFLRGLRAA